MSQTQTPTRRREERIDEQKRVALLSAAVAEIAKHGFEAASLQRVAAEAGITRGLVYYYWVDREDLLRAAVEHLRGLFTEALALWGAPTDSASFWASVEAVYGEAFRLLASRPHHLEFFRRLVEAAQSPNPHEPIRQLVEDAHEAISMVLGIGQAFGAVRSDVPSPLLRDAAFALAGASDAWAIRQVAAGAKPAECIAATKALLRGTLEPPARCSESR
jgi:AcrR family transcriptional regulator